MPFDMPFDMPLAHDVWQFYVNHELTSKLLCARVVQTTLVVCAKDRDEDARASLAALTDVGKEHRWTFSIPSRAV